MKVTFRTNLGSIDAKKFNLDFTKCKAGDTCEVSDAKVAEELEKSGIAVPVAKAEEDDVVKSIHDEKHRVDEQNRVKGIAEDPSIRGVRTAKP